MTTNLENQICPPHEWVYFIGKQEVPEGMQELDLGNCLSCDSTININGSYESTPFFYKEKQIYKWRDIVG